MQIGYASDIHHADKDTAIGRNYRDAEEKLGDTITDFNAEGLDFVIMNGDFVDAYDNTDETTTLAELGAIETLFATLTADRYYTYGNHDLEDLSKAQFKANTGMTDDYYYFDLNGFRFIFLDSWFVTDDDDDPWDHYSGGLPNNYIPPGERTWLQNTALDTENKCIIFCHARLDIDDGGHEVVNSSAVRSIIEAAGNVLAVFQGHHHRNEIIRLGPTTYITMEANVDDPYPTYSHGIITVYDNGYITVSGTGLQDDLQIPAVIQ